MLYRIRGVLRVRLPHDLGRYLPQLATISIINLPHNRTEHLELLAMAAVLQAQVTVSGQRSVASYISHVQPCTAIG